MPKKTAVTEIDDTSKDDVLEVVFDESPTEDASELTPLRHFNRVMKAGSASGPLANPRRIRLI
jgi:hypothetical protein